MRIYFHSYPTCPSCNEPHLNGTSLKKIDDNREYLNDHYLQCSNCSTCFSEYVDLISSVKFDKTVQNVAGNNNELRDKFKKFRLPWMVKLNLIEEEYINWLKEIEKGKFLITWPDNDVKFIPVLLSEYLLNKPDKKAAVIGKVENNSYKNNIIWSPAINEIFSRIIFLENPEKIEKIGDVEILNELKRFNYKYIIKKFKVVHYRIEKVGYRKFYSEGICHDTLRKCQNKIIRNLKKDFQGKIIRFIKEKKSSEKEGENICENIEGNFDIEFEEREEWSTKNINYDKNWLWNVILNHKKVKSLTNIIPAISIENSMKIDTGNSKLFFIPDTMDVKNIFELLKSLKCNLIVFQNTDDFIKDFYYKGEKSRYFLEFSSQSEESLILMFSTRPGMRYIYNINSENISRTGIRIRNYNIIPHTWDSQKIIEKIREKSSDVPVNYLTPLSSTIRTPGYDMKIPDIEFVNVEKLVDDLDKIIKKLGYVLDKDSNMVEDFIFYLNEMKKTPLCIRGDYRKPEFFSRIGKKTGKLITYDILMQTVYNSLEDENKKGIIDIFTGIYGEEFSNENPILEKIKEKIGELIKIENTYITIVVNKKDVYGTKKLIKMSPYKEFMDQSISVCSWGDVSRSEFVKDRNFKHYLISTLPPSPEYPLNNSKQDKIIFIGEERYLEKIKKIIDHRLDMYNLYPVYFLDEEDPAPQLLKETMKELKTPSNEIMQDLMKEIIMNFEEEINKSSASGKNLHIGYPYIKHGENALLVIDKDGNGIFISEGASLLFKEGNRFQELSSEDILSDEKLLESLKNKEILLDRHGLYISFRSTFIKLMLEYGRKIRFRKGPYNWSGFRELFSESVKWIEILLEAIKEYSALNGVTLNDAEDKISEYIASLGITARDPHYIKHWWKINEDIITEDGIYNIYRVGHPRNPHDLDILLDGLYKLLPGLKIEDFDPLKCYAASIEIQHFRSSLLKGNQKDLDESQIVLYKIIDKNLKEIIENLKTFRIKFAYREKISKDVEPYVLKNNFSDFIVK